MVTFFNWMFCKKKIVQGPNDDWAERVRGFPTVYKDYRRLYYMRKL